MAIRDLFRNYFYGRPGKRDFSEADLPETRVQLFFQVLGVRRGEMLGLNLIYLLIWLPAAAWSFLNLTHLWRLLASEDPSGAEISSLLSTWLLLLWPLVAITGPFNAGISLVMHRWARDEHSFPYADFWAGVKENWRQGLLFSALDGLVPLVFFLCANFYLNLAARSAAFLLPLGVSCLAALVWCLAAPLVPLLIVSYRQSLAGILRNAVLMALAQLPRAIGIRLLTLAPLLAAALSLLFFPGALPWIVLAACMLYALFLLALHKLIWASFANFLGEKYLNSKIPGAPTDIGLRPRGGE